VDADLPPNAMTAVEKLAFKRHRIHVLQKAESQSVVHLEKRAYDRPREPLFE
jgi:hypothetical protein